MLYPFSDTLHLNVQYLEPIKIPELVFYFESQSRSSRQQSYKQNKNDASPI